jgi:hypothetical protein
VHKTITRQLQDNYKTMYKTIYKTIENTFIKLTFKPEQSNS